MELTDNDRQRIEQEISRIWFRTDTAGRKPIELLKEIAEYATIYEREQQAKELGEAPENVNYGSPEHLRYVIRKLKAEKEKLEAERTELRNKVIEEVENYCKGIQKLAEWWNDDPTLVDRISGGHAAINRVLEYLNSLKK